MDPSKHGMHLQLVEAYREGTLGGGDVKLMSPGGPVSW
jgi:Flp pilus assembly protein protease CpaA